MQLPHRSTVWVDRADRAAAITATGILLLALATWCALMSADGVSAGLHAQLPGLARNFASALFLASGTIRMIVWRVTRDRLTARSALALLLIGTALPSTEVFGLIIHDGRVVDLEAPETRLVFVLPLIAIAIAAARHNRRLLLLTISSLVTCFLVVGAAVLGLSGASPAEQHNTGLWLAIESAAAAVWLTLAAQGWRRRWIAGRNTPGWLVTASLLMAAGDIVKARSLTDDNALHGASGGFQLAAAIIATVAAAGALGRLARTEAGPAGELTRALVDTQQRLTTIEELQRRRLHDARSAVLGVIGASHLLAGTDADVAPLRALVNDELLRLQGLLDTDGTEPITAFALSDALGTVVLARRLDGVVIDADWHGAIALGRARATATVLDNLLRNAHRHAPGAQVAITARVDHDEVEIVVRDDGPGIPRSELGLVLLAGMRGSTARGPGSGIGLFNAANEMAAQGGSLHVAERAGGGTEVVLRLPAAVTALRPALAG